MGRYKFDMFGMSGEHLLILGIVLLIFGPRRLPELGNTMGKAIRNFKDALSGVEEAKYRKIDDEKVNTQKLAAPEIQKPLEATMRDSHNAASHMTANGVTQEVHHAPPSSPV